MTHRAFLNALASLLLGTGLVACNFESSTSFTDPDGADSGRSTQNVQSADSGDGADGQMGGSVGPDAEPGSPGSGDPDAGQNGAAPQDSGSCDKRTELQADDETPFGFSPGEVMDIAAGQHSAIIVYSDGLTSTVTLSVSAEAPKFYYRTFASAPWDSPGRCEARIEIETDLRLVSEDGRLDERWSPGILEATGQDGFELGVELHEMFGLPDKDRVSALADQVSASPDLAWPFDRELNGDYFLGVTADICVPMVQVQTEVRADGFSGKLIDMAILSSCDDAAEMSDMIPITGLDGATWDSRCASAPADCCCFDHKRVTLGRPPVCNGVEKRWFCHWTREVPCGTSCESL